MNQKSKLTRILLWIGGIIGGLILLLAIAVSVMAAQIKCVYPRQICNRARGGTSLTHCPPFCEYWL